jgi:hypothetical protein
MPAKIYFFPVKTLSFSFAFGLFWISLGANLSWAEEIHPPVLGISQEIHDVELNRELPKYVEVAGIITFRWMDAEIPGFSINGLEFLNNTDPVVQSVEAKVDEAGRSAVSIAFRGKFECHNNFSAYPFNMPRVPVVFRRPVGNYVLQAPALSEITLQGVDGLPQSDSYSVTGRHFLEGLYYRAPVSHRASSQGDIHAVGLYLDLRHKPLRTTILVLLPLIAISLVSYSSQWWKDESAASRGIMASLFAATAVAVSSINLAPNVSCPTVVLIAFCCFYLGLIVLGILTVMAFREKTRTHPELFRKVRLTGRILGPVMMLVSIAFLTAWVQVNQKPDVYEWLQDPVKVSQVGGKAQEESASSKVEEPLLKCLECSPARPNAKP